MRAGIYRGMSDTEYHEIHDGDGFTASSSQLKTAIEDIELFHKKYVTQEIAKKHMAAFDVGNHFHTAILEPHLYAEKCVVWEGDRRAGKAWEKFQADNAKKIIVTLKENEEVNNLINAYHDSPIIKNIMSKGEAELSLFHEFMGLKGKVRADWIYLCPIDEDGESAITDLKSTTINVKDKREVKNVISNLSYDLSAAYYVDMFNDYLEKEGLLKKFKPITRFYWFFADKKKAIGKTWWASEKNMEVGRAKYRQAIALIKYYKSIGWKFPDFAEELDPNTYEEEWLGINIFTPPTTEVVEEDVL